MPDPISDVLRGATAWLQRFDAPEDIQPEDPHLLQAVALSTGLPEDHVRILVTRSWDRIRADVDDRQNAGTTGARLSALSFGSPSFAHPQIEGVTVVRLEDASWMSEGVLFRSQATDHKGRVYGTARNPAVPPLNAMKPRYWDVRADQLAQVIQERKHALFGPQIDAIQTLSNDELIAMNHEDPMSALEVDGGVSLTGGHHRTAEIVKRVTEGRMDPNTIVRLLVHD